MKNCPICNRRFGDDIEVCDFDGSVLRHSNHDPLVGTIIKHRYRVIEKFGQGSMSTVYLAEQVQVERKVLLKILSEEYAQDEAFGQRFRQEAKLISLLNHPRLIQLFDFDQADDGRLFIVTEYLQGKSLKTILQSRVLEIPMAMRIASQLVAGLGAAHSAGVIHRDITPDNILVIGDREDVKITDFGLARARESEAATRLTQVGTILGNPYYVSPEQIEGLETDERTDVYSFGIVLYEMLCNRVPFNATTPTAVWMQHLNDEPVPPTHLRPEIPPRLEEIVLRALQKKPEHRWTRMSEIADALSKIEKELGRAPATSRIPTPRTTQPPRTTPQQTEFGLSRTPVQSTKAQPNRAEPAPTELVAQTVVIDTFAARSQSESPAADSPGEHTVAKTMVMTQVLDAVQPRKIPWNWVGLAGATILAVSLASWYVFFGERFNQDQAKQSDSLTNTGNRAPAKIEAISLEIDNSELAVGQRGKLRLQARHTDGSRTPVEQIDSISWTSSNPSVAIVDTRGGITSTGSGTTDLKARHMGLESPPITLVVKSPAAKTPAEAKLLSLAIKNGRQQLTANERLKLHATGRYSDNRETEIKRGVRWESKNPEIATIDSTGTLLGRKEGRVDIIARYGQIASAPLTLLIQSPPVAKDAEPRPVKSVPTTKVPNVNEPLRNARTYLDQGQYTEALIELDKASKIDPGNRDVQTATANAKRACSAEKRLGRSDLKC